MDSVCAVRMLGLRLCLHLLDDCTPLHPLQAATAAVAVASTPAAASTPTPTAASTPTPALTSAFSTPKVRRADAVASFVAGRWRVKSVAAQHKAARSLQQPDASNSLCCSALQAAPITAAAATAAPTTTAATSSPATAAAATAPAAAAATAARHVS